MSKTALLAAAKNWEPRVVRRLLTRSPDLLGARAKGRTAVEHARRKRLAPTILAALGDPPRPTSRP